MPNDRKHIQILSQVLTCIKFSRQKIIALLTRIWFVAGDENQATGNLELNLSSSV